MTRTFEYTGRSGRSIKIVAAYKAEMVDRFLDADGFQLPAGRELSTHGSLLTIFLDGEKLDEIWDPAFWRVIDMQAGYKRIWGSRAFAFADAADASVTPPG